MELLHSAYFCRMINRLIIVVLVSIVGLSTRGQDAFPFELSPKVDGILGGTGLVLAGTGAYTQSQIATLTPTEISALNKSNISMGIDRKVTENWSPKAQQWSDIMLGVSGGSAIGFTIIQVPETKNWLTLGIMGLETALLTYGVTMTTKANVLRARPFVYNPSVDIDAKTKKDARESFFSGHTSMATATCVFSAEIFTAIHPDSRWKPYVRTASFILPASVGYFRVKGGKHFPSDVVVGYGVGAFLGWMVPRLHRKRDSALSFFPSQNGGRLIWTLP